MDKIERFRAALRRILDEYGNYKPRDPGITVERIVNAEQTHYEIMSSGWVGQNRIHGAVFHADIKDGKIWVQHDGTEIGLTNILLEEGIAKEDIVLAFHSPYKRQFTDFAVG